MNSVHIKNLNRTARLAGVLYLITVVTGVFGLMYVPSQVDIRNNLSGAIATQHLYRLGIAAALICYTAFLGVPLLLYLLLSSVNRNAALVMGVFAMTNVPLALLSIAKKLDVLSLLDRAGAGATLGSDQLNAQVLQLLDAYGHGMLISQIFAGLWLIPFGYLVFRSGFLPRVLGALLVVGGLGYLVTVFGHVLIAGYDRLAVPNFDTLPAGLGEIGISLWLLLVGVRVKGIGYIKQ